MVSKRIGDVWKVLPPSVRRLIVRATQPTFTVSAGAVITNENGEILLLDHVIRPHSGWGIPGGFVDHGEQPTVAIRREVREETGIELEDLEMVRVRTVGSHIEIIFRARAVGEPIVRTREITDLGWFTPDGIEEKSGRAQREAIEKVLRADV